MAGIAGKSGRTKKPGKVYRFDFYYRFIPGEDPFERAEASLREEAEEFYGEPEGFGGTVGRVLGRGIGEGASSWQVAQA